MACYSHFFKNFQLKALAYSVKQKQIFFLGGGRNCWQFDLWFLCLIKIQLVHLEVLGSLTAKV